MKEKSNKIKDLLKSQNLRESILQVDNAKSRLWELNKKLDFDPNFKQFTDLLLTEMGLLDEQGQLKPLYEHSL